MTIFVTWSPNSVLIFVNVPQPLSKIFTLDYAHLYLGEYQLTKISILVCKHDSISLQLTTVSILCDQCDGTSGTEAGPTPASRPRPGARLTLPSCTCAAATLHCNQKFAAKFSYGCNSLIFQHYVKCDTTKQNVGSGETDAQVKILI